MQAVLDVTFCFECSETASVRSWDLQEINVENWPCSASLIEVVASSLGSALRLARKLWLNSLTGLGGVACAFKMSSCFQQSEGDRTYLSGAGF